MMTDDELAVIAQAIGPVVRDLVRARIQEELAPLHARLVALEQRPTLRFCGPWTAATTYAAGALVQRSSALWLAIESSAGAPPGTDEGSGLWRLIVKTHS
jgi:hypothetical protein